MRRRVFEELKNVIAEQTSAVEDRVTNLHGTVAAAVERQSARQGDHRWFVTAVKSSGPLDFHEFFVAFQEQSPDVVELPAQDHEIGAPVLSGPSVVMMATAIQQQTPSAVPIRVKSNNGDIRVYHNRALRLSGTGTLNKALQLPAGLHFLVFLIHTNDPDTRVRLSTDLNTSAAVLRPAAPKWLERPHVVYVNPGTGDVAISMSWGNEVFASNWDVQRAEGEPVADIESVTDNGDGTYSITWSYDLAIEPGEEFYTTGFYGGKVLSVSRPGTSTTVVVRVAETAPVSPVYWEAEWFSRPGPWRPVGKVSGISDGAVEYSDTSASPHKNYAYRVVARALIGETPSPPSLVSWVYSNDKEAPAHPVTVNTSGVLGSTVTINFRAAEETSPGVWESDEDYSGVVVYGPYNPGVLPTDFQDAERVKTEYGEPGAFDQLSFSAEGASAADVYYLAAFDSLGNTQTPALASQYAYPGDQAVSGGSAPILNPRVVFNADRTAASIEVDVESASGENVRLHFRDTEDGTRWSLVAGDQDSTPLFVADSTTIFPATAWFFDGTTYAQKLQDISLVQGQLTRVYLQGEGATSGIFGTWQAIPLNALEQPQIEKLDAVWDEVNDRLEIKVQAGLFCETVDIEVADNSAFTTPVHSDLGRALTEGQSHTTYLALDVVTREKIWYVRATPHNGNIQGLAHVDPEYIPAPSDDLYIKVEVIASPFDYDNDSVAETWEENLTTVVAFSVVDPEGSTVSSFTLQQGNGAATPIGSVSGMYGPFGGIYYWSVSRIPKVLERVLTLEAVMTDGRVAHTVFVLDWDRLPEVVQADAGYDLNATTHEVVGWDVSWSVDDDTFALDLSGTLAAVASNTPTAIAGGSIDTSAVKTGILTVPQGPGESGTLILTPKTDTGQAGKAVSKTLQRSPITMVSTRELSITKEQVILTAIPSDAIIRVRDYLIADTPGAYSDYASPALLVFERADADQRVVEFYSVKTGVPAEEPRKLVLDADSDPSVVALTVTSQNDNEITISPTLDSDTAFYRVYSRPQAWPTNNGAVDGEVVDDYLRGELLYGAPALTHYAKGAPGPGGVTWYVIVEAYDYAGRRGPNARATGSVVVLSDAGVTLGTISGVGVTEVVNGSSVYHRVSWSHDSTIESDYGTTNDYYLVIRQSIEGNPGETVLTSSRHPALDSEIGDPYSNGDDGAGTANYGSLIDQVGTKPVSSGAWVTFNYVVELYYQAGLINTFTASRSSWLSGGTAPV